jgi:hypothetical protein
MRFHAAALCATALLATSVVAQDEVLVPEAADVPEASSSAVEKPVFTVRSAIVYLVHN